MSNTRKSAEYAWETGYEKTWEALRDDDSGLFAPISFLIPDAEKKRKHKDKIGRLGMIRNLTIIMDCSESMLDQDLKPTRHLCAYKLIQDFIKEFLENNSISQIGIIITRNQRAEKISELSGNANKLLDEFKKCEDVAFYKGEPSLQNSLELALTTMNLSPTYTSREILIISGNLTLVDPGHIQDTIQILKDSGIRCSVIGLSAEMFVFKALCHATDGEYNVVLDDHHFQKLLNDQVKPHADNKNCVATCVKIGFCSSADNCIPYTSCICHSKQIDKLNADGYFCPQCRSKCCELPTQCKTCGISLATSAHIIQPLHYLISPPQFDEFTDNISDDQQCYACQKLIKPNLDKLMRCNNCKYLYCVKCHDFVRTELYFCPGCAVAEPEKDM